MESLHSLLPSLLPRLLGQGPLSAGKIELAWHMAVGKPVARVTRVQLDEKSVVRVTVPDEHWRREIQRSEAVILARLETLLGKDVVTRLDVSTVSPQGPRTKN